MVLSFVNAKMVLSVFSGDESVLVWRTCGYKRYKLSVACAMARAGQGILCASS